MKSRSATVYFVKPKCMAGPIKIGCSELPASRIEGLTIWSPFELEIIVTIPGSFTLERNIQECFAHAHSHREWFLPVPALLTAIEKLKAGVPVEEAIDLTHRTGKIRGKGCGGALWSQGMRRGMGLHARARAACRRVEEATRKDFRLPDRMHQVVNSLKADRPLSGDDEAYITAFFASPADYLVRFKRYVPPPLPVFEIGRAGQ